MGCPKTGCATDGAGDRTAGDAADLASPGLKCLALFCLEPMALIDTDDSGAGSADMTEDGFDGLQPNSETLQSGGNRTPNVVQSPWRQRAAIRFCCGCIESSLRLGPPADRGGPVGGEYVIAGARQGAD